MTYLINLLLSKDNGNDNHKNENEIEMDNLQVKKPKQHTHNILVVNKIHFFPVIYGAAPAKNAKDSSTPEKPPNMKYKDLPIYESPHYEYKAFEEDKNLCIHRNAKILHTAILPTVQYYRSNLVESVCGMTNELNLMKNEACDALQDTLKNFVDYMRLPDNLIIRQATVLGSTLLGAIITSGGNILRLFGGTAGALASGALCFPEKTDETVRCVAFSATNTILAAIGLICNKNMTLKPILCRNELPPHPVPLTEDQKNKCEKPKPARKTAPKSVPKPVPKKK